MKITVCGKGGCGKSTVTSLLAKALAGLGKEVLVIDSDESNYGLHRQLGMELPGDFTGYFGGKESVLNDVMLSKFTHQFFQETWTLKEREAFAWLKDHGASFLLLFYVFARFCLFFCLFFDCTEYKSMI